MRDAPTPSFSEDDLRQALQKVTYPGFRRDILSFGLVKEVAIHGSDVKVQLAVTTAETKIPAILKEEVEAALKQVEGVGAIKVLVDVQSPLSSGGKGEASAQGIEGVKHVIAIASGKGGVGKSTVALNLALALSSLGFRVGLCDCDLYGPSLAMMLGAEERPTMNDQDQIIPVQRQGLALMSMGLLLKEEAPAVLRGPMVTRYTQQFLRQVDWSGLDYLLLDLPPGTGDIQLTIVQTVALHGAILVTTPQEVALIDVRKAATMFEKTNVRLLGLIENMSYYLSPTDHTRHAIFGKAQGKEHAASLGIPLLAEIPLDPEIGRCGDQGYPFFLAHQKSAQEKKSSASAQHGSFSPTQLPETAIDAFEQIAAELIRC